MNTKLIVALDFAKQSDALALVEQLDPKLCALKVGSQMFTLFGSDFVRLLIGMGFKIFLDLKFHDIPNTVAEACKASADLGVWMINVHASGGLIMMEAALKALETYSAERPKLVAVTVLTSMGNQELPAIGISDSLENQVQRLVRLTADAGLDGVVCSAHEVPLIKQTWGAEFLTVTPGIRLLADSKDDQTRVMTPRQAVENGCDFLVVGRSITSAPLPAKVVQDILRDLSTCQSH